MRFKAFALAIAALLLTQIPQASAQVNGGVTSYGAISPGDISVFRGKAQIQRVTGTPLNQQCLVYSGTYPSGSWGPGSCAAGGAGTVTSVTAIGGTGILVTGTCASVSIFSCTFAVDPATNIVSFNGRFGAVVPVLNDYSFALISGLWTCAQSPAFTGPVTKASGSCATAITSGAVTNAMLANMAVNTVKGSIAGGVPVDLTATQVTTLCNLATNALKGCLPVLSNNATDYFSGAGTFVAVPAADTYAGFTTRTAAIAATIPAVVRGLCVNGFSAVNDLGAACYSKMGSVPAPVKLWQFQSADGAYWQYQGLQITPFQLGAIGNGATDDSVILQAWMDYCGTTSYGVSCFLPQGNFAVNTATLTLSTGTIYDGAGDNAIITRTGVVAAPLIQGTSLTGTSLKNVRLHYAGASTPVNGEVLAARFTNSSGCVFSHVYVTGNWYVGLEDRGGTADEMLFNRIHGVVNRGLYITSNDTPVATNSTGQRVIGNSVLGSTFAGGVRQTNYLLSINAWGVAGFGVILGIEATNNSLRTSNGDGVNVGAAVTGTLANNYITDIIGPTGASNGILLVPNTGVSVQSFNILGNNISNSDTGILLLTAFFINVEGNNITSMGYNGIRSDVGQAITIVGNKVNGCGSTATAGNAGINITGASQYTNASNNMVFSCTSPAVGMQSASGSFTGIYAGNHSVANGGGNYGLLGTGNLVGGIGAAAGGNL